MMAALTPCYNRSRKVITSHQQWSIGSQRGRTSPPLGDSLRYESI